LRRATSLAYTDADEDAERLLSFADSSTPGAEGDEWVETHAGRKVSKESTADHSEIAEIPDIDAPVDDMAGLSIGDGKVPETLNLDDIPDMEEDLEDEDEATAAPKPAPSKLVEER